MLKQKRSIIQLNPWCREIVNMLNDPNSEAHQLLGPHAVEFNPLLSALTAAEESVERLSALRGAAVKTCEDALASLSQYCGDARAVIFRRLKREDVAEVVRQRFEKTGERPSYAKSPKWIPLTVKMLSAEAHAVELGQSMMAYPSAGELQEVLTAAEAARQAVKDSDLAYRNAADELRRLNDTLYILWQDTSSWFRYSLRRRPKPAQRAIMRRFGFEFTEGGADDTPGVGSDPADVEDPPSSGGEEPGGAGNEPEPSGQAEEPSGQAEEPAQSGEPVGSSTSNPQPTQPSGSGGGSPQQTPSGTTPNQPPGDRDSDQPAGNSTQTPPIIASDGGPLDYGR